MTPEQRAIRWMIGQVVSTVLPIIILTGWIILIGYLIDNEHEILGLLIFGLPIVSVLIIGVVVTYQDKVREFENKE